MIDRDQLREALAYWDGIERTEPRRVSLTWAQLDELLEAARLVVEGRDIEWCVNHDLESVDGECEAWLTGRVVNPCRMVPMILIDGNTE